MKKIFLLLVLLITFISCEKDIKEIGKCIYSNPKVQEIAGDIMKAIITKDFSKLLPKLKEFFPDALDIILNCLKEEIKTDDMKVNFYGGQDACIWNCKVYHSNSHKEQNDCCNQKCGKAC